MLTADECARYSRHLSLPEIGVVGQEKIKTARILIVGAGGLGSPASLYLAAAGVGTLGIIDHDRIDLSNLQRQILFESTQLGASKADTARARLLALNPEISVQAYNQKLTADNAVQLIQPYDLVIDGSDRLATRYLINDVCVILRKPLVSAAIYRFEGQAMTYVPERGPCYRCLFPQSIDGMVPNCAEAGVLGVLPGVFGALQAAEALKIVLDIGTPLLGRLLTFDALDMRWQEFKFTRRLDCAVCGESASIRTPQDSAAAGQSRVALLIERLQPRALHARLQLIGDPPILIDVRENHEYSVSHLPEAINIPLRELSQRLGEIRAAATSIFICRSGARSLAAASLAIEAGHPSVAHLEGGMLAWAQDIEPAMVVADALKFN